MDDRVDIADRLDALADQIKGMSHIISIMREHEELQGIAAEHYLLLQNVTENFVVELEAITARLWEVFPNEEKHQSLDDTE